MRGARWTSVREHGVVGRTGGRRRSKIALPLLALIGLAPLVLAGCSVGGGQTGHLASSQVFTWPFYAENAADPNHPNFYTDAVLDPAAVAYLVDDVNVNMLFTTLLSFNSSLQIVPNAAISMPTVSADGRTYTFHLRPNMHFSDGTPLTAQDFAYSWNRALDPTICSQLDAKSYPGLCAPLAYGPDNTGYLGHIVGAGDRNSGKVPTIVGTGNGPDTGVIVQDPLTLEVRIDKPIRFFLDTMTFPTSAVVEQKLVENKAYAGGLWVRHLDSGGCSGPFMVQSYGNGSTLTMVPNPYWEKAWKSAAHAQRGRAARDRLTGH